MTSNYGTTLLGPLEVSTVPRLARGLRYHERRYMSKTSDENTAIAIYRTLKSVEAAIGDLRNSGFDLRKVSIVGKDQPRGGKQNVDPNVAGQSIGGEALWQNVLTLFPSRTLHSLPGDGCVIVGGPLSECMASALENPVIFGRLSTLCAGLYILGLPADSALKLEEEVRHDKFLVMAIGTSDEVSLAKKILQSINRDRSQRDV